MKELFHNWNAPRYVGPRFHPLDITSYFFELISLLPVGKIESEGTEVNIPNEPHIALFVPHSGVETQPIDRYYRKVGKIPPVIVTKTENEVGLPWYFGGHRRFIYMNRHQPGPSLYRNISLIIANQESSLLTAIEGTRFGNPDDPSDIKTLKEAEPGFVRIAINHRLPILPIVVLGCDQFLTTVETLKKEKGTKAVLKQLIKEIRKKEKPIVQIRFTQPYTDHIIPEGDTLKSSEVRERAQIHTDRIMKEIAIPIIRELDPNYPLGPYEQI